MKKYFFSLLALATAFVMPSCSEKFKIAAPYKNITVVYGILQRADTAHYIRVQKAFMDDNLSGLDMAKSADSSFYNNITVVLKKFDYYSKGYIGSITLNKVDLNNEGYPKDSGTFFNAPSYAYKFTEDLNPNTIYRLVVTNAATGEVDSAEAPVIDDKTNESFYIYKVDDTLASSKVIDFASTLPNKFTTLAGIYKAPYMYNFQGYSTPVGIAQAVLRFNWVDSNISTGEKVARYYDADLGYKGIQDGTFKYDIKHMELFSSIMVGMGKAPAYIVRLMDRCEFSIYLGSHDFNTYIKAQAQQGVGLTGNEIKPVYTNMKGANVLGLFTARGHRSGPITISGATIDTLVHASITADMRIKGTIYH